MKIFAISDLHLSFSSDKPMEIFGSGWDDYFNKIKTNWQRLVKEEDIVLIAGDISWAMTLENAVVDFSEIAGFRGRKIIIRGNHDYWWKSVSRLREALPEGFTALQNDSVKIGNYIFCGTRGWTAPGTPGFSQEDRKIYDRECERLKLTLSSAAKLKEEGCRIICMTHFPPFNVNREPGKFTDLITEYGVAAVVYGHLHGKDCRADKKVVISGVPYYLTSCDLIEHKPVLII